MGDTQCKDCQYFLQHYILVERRFSRVHCGHCTFDRARRKQPDARACEHFAPGTANEDAFASKEYLSKKLLEYVLRLDLLPKIEDA